ncbi:MAG TPA: response regulator, partial [Myxococcales bacterium]|nr:response regulator [Myxococcales bacterium]
MAKQSLLVADADPRSLRILEVALRKAGFAVTTATDGAEVLRRLQRTQLDALLCELTLPGDDGLSVCRSVRADARLGGLPIILMNADREPATREAALQAGADEFLPKPLLIKEVVARVRALLAQREQDRNSQRGAPAAITGTVGDLGLVDLFTSLDNWQRSATVLCEGDGRSARVWVRDGQVVDAEVPPLSGEAAFYRLLNWDAGSFRVDFGPVDREARTDAGTQGLLMEGMRRIDEMARLAETLPLSTVLAVDFPRLLTHLAEMPDELNGVLRLFDGVRTVREVIAGAPIDDLSTMAAVQKLLADGVLVRGTPAVPRQKPSLQQWLGSDPPPPTRAPPVRDEDLPLAEVLATPPKGHPIAAVSSSQDAPSESARESPAVASEGGEVVAGVTPIRQSPVGGSSPDAASGSAHAASAAPPRSEPAPSQLRSPAQSSARTAGSSSG